MQAPVVNWPPRARFDAPAAGEIHVYAFPLDAAPEVMARFTAILSAEERQRAEQFKMEHLRRRYKVAHGAMRTILGGCVQRAPEALEFAFSSRGKPRLTSGDVEFNLAHSDELGLLAVTRGSIVGVDVERVRPMPDGLDIARRFFSKREVADFETIPKPEHHASFFNLWTRKEAWLKATGDGISESLSKVEFTFRSNDVPRVLSIDGDASAAEAWSLFTLSPAAEFVGALAIPAKDVRLSCWQAMA